MELSTPNAQKKSPLAPAPRRWVRLSPSFWLHACLPPVTENDAEQVYDDTNIMCGVCGIRFSDGDHWVFCGMCITWYHGRCVAVTPEQLKSIKQYRCPSCCSYEGATTWNVMGLCHRFSSSNDPFITHQSLFELHLSPMRATFWSANVFSRQISHWTFLFPFCGDGLPHCCDLSFLVWRIHAKSFRLPSRLYTLRFLSSRTPAPQAWPSPFPPPPPPSP